MDIRAWPSVSPSGGLKDGMAAGPVGAHPEQRRGAQLVWSNRNSFPIAVRSFRLSARRERRAYPRRSVRSEQRRGSRKERRPLGLRRKWPWALLLLSHRARRLCSFVAPRPRPFWAQRLARYSCYTTLVLLADSEEASLSVWNWAANSRLALRAGDIRKEHRFFRTSHRGVFDVVRPSGNTPPS
jgi:hypothetical protein